MTNLKLDNFDLIKFDFNNEEHNLVIRKLCDKNKSNYLGDLFYSIALIRKRQEENYYNEAYIAYYNDYPIGFISLSYKNSAYEISYGILKEYRNQHLGTLLLDEFSEVLFNNYEDINNLTLVINKNNIASIKLANMASYESDTKDNYTRHRM